MACYNRGWIVLSMYLFKLLFIDFTYEKRLDDHATAHPRHWNTSYSHTIWQNVGKLKKLGTVLPEFFYFSCRVGTLEKFRRRPCDCAPRTRYRLQLIAADIGCFRKSFRRYCGRAVCCCYALECLLDGAHWRFCLYALFCERQVPCEPSSKNKKMAWWENVAFVFRVFLVDFWEPWKLSTGSVGDSIMQVNTIARARIMSSPG